MRTLKLLILFFILFLCGCQCCKNIDDDFITTPEYVLIDKETIIL